MTSGSSAPAFIKYMWQTKRMAHFMSQHPTIFRCSCSNSSHVIVIHQNSIAGISGNIIGVIGISCNDSLLATVIDGIYHPDVKILVRGPGTRSPVTVELAIFSRIISEVRGIHAYNAVGAISPWIDFCQFKLNIHPSCNCLKRSRCCIPCFNRVGVLTIIIDVHHQQCAFNLVI